MANTSDLIGEQAVLDGLIAHTLTDFEDDTITKLRGYAFYQNPTLQTVVLPNVAAIGFNTFQNCTALTSAVFDKATSVSNNMFSGCTALQTVSFPLATMIGSAAFQNAPTGVLAFPSVTSVASGAAAQNGPAGFDFTKKITIPANAFNSAYNFKHLILRSSELCPLSNVNAFTNSPIGVGLGYIYVPSDLVDTYKAATNWSTYADQIVPISEYPKAATGTITDSWAQILANEDNGTYSTKYSIGDTRIVSIGGEDVLMEIVAFDTDDLAAGGKSKITWISKGAIEMRRMNATGTTANGWADTEMRSYLRDTLYPTIESTVRSAIKEVTKTYRVKSQSDTTASITDTVWIPSNKEAGFTNASYVESSGVVYSGKFVDNTSRVKLNSKVGLGAASGWWLRSAYTSSTFGSVGSSGGEGSNGAANQYGLVLGFCT